ncbi:hypothetical protein RJ639_006987 [Escallonia herrerae]|uniref:Uncharacterized protein n=1 Tax=Escallonia herrerae TaxID=1293975 RepID=A0AA89AZI4_9ASTE|nr:hypothetical protein RJ639_006987 [Escallonia herrerae]
MKSFIKFLLVMVALRLIQAVEFKVSKNVTGAPGNEQILQVASEIFVWQLSRKKKDQRKNVNRVMIIVESYNGVVYTENNVVHLSAKYAAD